MSLLLCDMAADVDCRRWSLVVREKTTVPSRRLKFSGFCVRKFCVRMGQRARSNQHGALTLNPPHFRLGDRSILSGSSLKELCRTAWSQSPVTFGFDLEMLCIIHCHGLQGPNYSIMGRQKYQKHNTIS